MLLIQHSPESAGLSISASREISDYFIQLAARHGTTLEVVVERTLVGGICSAISAPDRDREAVDALVARKLDDYTNKELPHAL